MFKLESYITPILLDYVSKYVKNIRQEDFQLSLWEGEVALHNLDLRLDVLQEELNLPQLEFISGHIHDLSIRVPWTKITSEPIVITINTIEFVLKLKNPREDGAASSTSSSPQRTNEHKKKRKCPPKPEERGSNPESSSSWLVSKIIHNISLQCHNIILKYVEEDIVVSMNIQLLSFGSANETWQSGMIDVHPIKVLMRKLVKISDLTICLDKRNSAGQIDVCQEPILYRSSFECRILLKFNANNPQSNRITRIGVFTSLLDMNISSMQIPLCLRLIKLVLAFKDGKINKASTPDATEDCIEEEESEPTDQSYLQWAWNKLPSISFAPGYEDEETNEAPCHTLDIGFYAGQLSFTLKSAEFITDTHMTATKRIRYSPIVRLTIMGMYFEFVLAEARNWLSVKAGVTSICVEPLGAYQSDSAKLIQSEESHNKRPFIDKSLFDEQCLIADKGWGVTNYDEYTARITDDYLLYRSPVLAFDLIKYKQSPETDSSDSTSRSASNTQNANLENRVQYRFLTAGLTFRYSQTLEQVKHLISEFINSYDYPAYYTETLDGGSILAATVGHKLPPPLMEDYDALMRHIPLCTYKFSVQKLTIEVHAKTEVDASASTPKPHFRRLNSGGLKIASSPPHFIINVANMEGSISTPLQPDKLVHTTCQLPEKPQKLFDACYENFDLQIKDFSCLLRNTIEDRSSRILHVPSLNIKYGKLLQSQHWKEETVEVQKLHLFCENIKMNFTRRELSSSYYLIHCAWIYRPLMLRRLLRQEAPDFALDDSTKLHNDFTKFSIQWQHTPKQKHWNLMLYGLESTIVHKQRNDVIKQMVFSTSATKSYFEVPRWFECSLLFSHDDASKYLKSKSAIGVWMAPFAFKIDANLIQFLRCEKFDEMDRETIVESIISSQILNIPNIPSSGSVQSHTGSILNTSQPVPTPPVARRSSRSSLQIRKVSHPEETIHVSSERDEKLDKETTTSTYPKSPKEPNNRPMWLSIIKSYEFYVEIESGTIHIAEDLESDAVFTKIILPKLLLKPSNFEAVKASNFRQLFSLAVTTKDKSNISWTLTLNDFGIVNEIGNDFTEALLEPIHTTVTIALTHKSEKIKTTTTDVKEEIENSITLEKSPLHKENPVSRTMSAAHMQRSNTPSEADFLTTGSVTVGGRSEKSFSELFMQSDLITVPSAIDTSNANFVSTSKKSPKKLQINRDVYTFNLYADTTPIRFLISNRKMRTFEEHLNILMKVIKLSKPMSQSDYSTETANEHIEIVTATEENATIKEFMDLETSSESSKQTGDKKETQLIIALFCQWTITRIAFEIEANSLNYRSSKIIVDFEDILSTVDKREDYTKCTSKVGNLNVTYYEETSNNDWMAFEHLTIRLVGETQNLPFLNVIFTSVGLKQFFKRIGAKRKGDLNRNLSEIIITMQALEIIVNLEKIGKFVAAISGFFDRHHSNAYENEIRRSEELQKYGSANPIAASDLPMIHLDSKGFALYLPMDNGRDCCSVAIFRIASIRITPNLQNPLQRKPLRPDVFGKAAQLGMLGTPGAIIEDRQYELTLKNISAATGSWSQISTQMSEQRDNFFRTNPAVEWNNQNRKPNLQITDIFNNFCFIAIYAPSVVYQNVLICGQVIEFNCSTDFVASLNMFQLNMLSCLIVYSQRILCFMQDTTKKRKRVVLPNCNNRKMSTKSCKNGSTTTMFSGKSSSSSTLLCLSTTSMSHLRDARNSSAFSSIDEDTEHNVQTTDSGFQSCISQCTNSKPTKDFFGSFSTMSSTPAVQSRHVPQTISLVAGVFLIKFFDAKLRDNTDSDIYGTSDEIIRTPLFSITLSQPSFMFTQNIYDSTMQISLYDFYIYLTVSNPSAPVSHLVFNELILDTRPGQANAAGITPPLLSIRHHCTKMQLSECEINIAKPIALLLTEQKVNLLCQHILLVHATLLEDPCFEVRSKRNVLRGSKIKLMRQQCFDADRLQFNCRSFSIRFQNDDNVYNCKIVAADMKFNIKFLNRPEKATAKASIGALYLLADQKAIVHPINVRLSADFVSEPWHQLPLVTAILKANMVHLDIGISSLLHLQQACKGYERLMDNLQRQWRQFLKNRPFDKEEILQKRNLEMLKCPPTSELSASSSKCSMQREEFYQDDLRAGAFQFVKMYTDSFLPMPYQIQIIKKNFGIICWRYPQPRKMNRIHVYPVPIHPIQIKCRMEYYSEAHETFLHFCDFYLSETISKQIELPEREICANIWRVVILQSLVSINGDCFDDMIPEEDDTQKSITSIKIDDMLNNEPKESDFILDPKMLVGCMRIDTIFESSIVPKTQLLFQCNFLTIKMLNQPNEGQKLPSLLKKFNLIQTTQISQAFLIVNLQNLNVHTSLVSSQKYNIESSVTCSIKCLDYGFLNMLPVLEETSVQSCIQVETKTAINQRDIGINFVVNNLRLNMGPSIVHSLLASKQHWEEYLELNKPIHALVPKCIIVNRTYTYLTFGQSGTNERVQLKVRECCLYSFRSDYHNQELTFFITDTETEMTEVSQPVPISLKFNGEVLVQPVRVGKKCLFIKSRKLSPMQICIMIKGQIELVSMVPHNFYLDFRRESKTGPDKKSIEYLIEQRERACFCYSVQQRSKISVRLRFVSNSTTFKARSGDIPLESKKNLPWLVKVPQLNGEFISFWVRIFREDIPELSSENFKPQKILITIWSIFEICSMLSIPVQAEEGMTSKKLDIPAMGKCEVLDVPVTHLTEHPIRFEFNDSISEKSQNEFILTLKMFDWREFFWYDEQIRNIENVLSELGKPCNVKWPCKDEEELRVKRAFEEPKSSTIQYNCVPSRELSCTLRLEISPWGYFVNSTSIPISFMNGTSNDFTIINSNNIQMLFAVQKFFTLEVGNTTNFISSGPIYFEDTVSNAVSGSQYYVISEKTHTDIVILRSDQVLKFVLSLKIEGNRKILTLRSKFVVTNFSKHKLCILPFAMDHKETATRTNVENLDTKAFKLNTHVMDKKDDCIGVLLDNFYDIFTQKAKRTIDTAFVCFVCIKICTDSDVPIPIPLSMPFTRRCFSAQNNRESIAFAVTLIEHDGIYYLNIFPDPSPALFINNQTDVNFVIAQTSASENSKVTSTTMEYIGRHFEWYQILKSYSNCYYTPPEMYANFPDVDSAMCNLTLALYKENLTKREIKWSKPIRTDKSWEKFLHIPNHGDVKVIICDKHRIVRVSIFYILQQKEFSVKDLRSRLLTTQPSSSIESDSDSVSSITTQQSSPTKEKLIQYHPTEHCIHFQTNDTTTTTLKTHFQLHVYAKEIILSLNTDNKERDCLKTEVLSTYVDDFMLVYDDASAIKADGRTLNLLFSNLQIDNQLHSTGNFDFPVIICAQNLYQRTSFLPQPHGLECIYKELSTRAPMILIGLKLFDDEMSISDINCSLSPLRAYIEDAYLNELLDALVECAPSNCIYTPKTNVKRIELIAGESVLPREIAAQAICIAEPLQLRSFRIEPLNVLLSVHTSVRLYIALDHSPLSFSSYQRQQILTVPLRFGQSLGMHYLSGAIFGAGWVVGSLEILGSPSGLARSFTTGLRDFVAMPVQGLFRGPWGFIVGITQGSASLLRNVTAGTLNSVTKLAASVARNLDRLTLDREHIERTEALRRVRPNSLTEGFSQGLTGLGISILGAVGGIAHHTLEARSPVEVVTGVGKGLVGALTKPISGAAELLALAGQGVLQTVGFNALPQQRILIVTHSPNEPSAYRIWKLLPSVLVTDQVLFYHEITLKVQQQLRSAYVFLTSTVFAILISQWDKLEFAYAVNKVEITRDREDKTLCYVHITRENDELEDNISYTNERIMNFLLSSSSIRESRKMSMFSLQELLHSVGNEDQTNIMRRNLDWSFYINEHLGEHLMQYLKILRNEV